MCMGTLPTFLYVQLVHTVPLGARRGHCFPRTEITDTCEPHPGLWELNPHLLQEQVLLTAEPSFQLPKWKYFKVGL